MSSDLKAQLKRDWEYGPYYQEAEAWVDRFWAPDTLFRRLFDMLDTQALAELACGHGRHAALLLREGLADNITLIDVNESNISFCKERFKDLPRITAIVNSGSDLSEVQSNSLTALFCYDAMVHFEFDDVLAYLQDFHRVLRKGGRALLHHSNNDREPGRPYSSCRAGRNFMTKALFAHMASRAGLRVLHQSVLDWGEHQALDCVSLVEAPILP